MDNFGANAFSFLEKLNFIRTSGSPEETRAAQILFDELTAMGLSPQIETFTVQQGKISEVSLSACGRDWEVTGYGRSGSTPAEGITAPFAYVQDATPVDLAGVQGKIVLVNGRCTEKVYAALVEAKVAGFITFSGTVADELDKTDLELRALRDWALRYGVIPGVNLRAADALALVRSEPQTVTMRLVQQEVEAESRNVAVQLPGTGDTGETVVFGAHYDSVPFSHGVYDNGAGSAILMELVRYFKDHPAKRNLRFVWFGSEEVGLLGSKAYVEAHKEELSTFPLMINVDVAAPVLGKDWAKITGDQSLCHVVEYLSKEVGFPIEVQQGVYSSDSVPFADQGVPGINFCRFGAPGGALIHCRHDVMDYLDGKNLQATAQFILTFCLRVVNAVVFPVPREIPKNVVEELDNYLRKKPVSKLPGQQEEQPENTEKPQK